jgi:hypothetical protein
MRLRFEHCLRPIVPFDQSIGRAGEAAGGQRQALLLRAGIEEAPPSAGQAGGEIGDQPMLEGVTAVVDAIGVLRLAGDAMLLIPELARAAAGLGGVQVAAAVVASADARREWPRRRLVAARRHDQFLEVVEPHHDAAFHRSASPSCFRRKTCITFSSIERRMVGHEISTGFC